MDSFEKMAACKVSAGKYPGLERQQPTGNAPSDSWSLLPCASLVAADFLMLASVVALTWLTNFSVADGELRLQLALGTLLLMAFLVERGAYPAQLEALPARLGHVAMAWLQALGCMAVLALLFGAYPGAPESGTSVIDITKHPLWNLFFLVLVPLPLIGLRLVWPQIVRRIVRPRRAILVGANELSRRFLNDIMCTAQPSIEFIAVISETAAVPAPTFCGIPVVGSIESLPESACAVKADLAVIALPSSCISDARAIVGNLATVALDVAIVPDLDSLRWDGRQLQSQAGWPVLQLCRRPLAGWGGVLKRVEDVVFGSLLLLFAAPIMALIAVLIKIDTRGPVLFCQPREGLNGRVFRLLKFRTMHWDLSDLGAHRQTSRGDKRVTRIGAILRRTSLDELPQLVNVLGGSMSLIGPRPHALKTTAGGIPLAKAVPVYLSRYRVKPGITGLAQINGARGQLTSVPELAKRVSFDIQYVERWSLGLDLWILWRTACLVLFDKNAY